MKLQNKLNETLKNRDKEYGSFARKAEFIQIILGGLGNVARVTPVDPVFAEVYRMFTHKVSRLVFGNWKYYDTSLDMVGYLQLLIDEYNPDLKNQSYIIIPNLSVAHQVADAIERLRTQTSIIMQEVRKLENRIEPFQTDFIMGAYEMLIRMIDKKDNSQNIQELEKLMSDFLIKLEIQQWHTMAGNYE